jgi:hypothetical protein
MKKILNIEYPVGLISGRGIFSILSSVLWQIEWGKREGLVPFVGKIESIDYCERTDLTNFWTQYFLPSCVVEPEDTIINIEKNLLGGYVSCNAPTENFGYLTRYRPFCKEYIRLNSFMEGELLKAKQLLNNKKTLGVHYRGTDKMVIESGYISPQQYEKTMIETCKNFGFEQVFISTDEIEAFEYFKSKQKDYPFKVIFTDSFRVSKKYGNNFASICVNETQNLKFNRGKEALIDCYLLAECQTIIRNRSNLSSFSIICSDNIKTSIYLESKTLA